MLTDNKSAGTLPALVETPAPWSLLATNKLNSSFACFTVFESSGRVLWIGGNEAVQSVHFEVRAPSAHRVSLVGDFNAWNASALPMRRSTSGAAWGIDVHLPVGRHAFAYAVDGRLIIDSTAALAVDDNFGVPSSVVVVSLSGGK